MSQQNPTIIVGHLDDSELTKSIDKLVNEVANKTTTMAGHFTTAIGKMQDAMKDFAVTQKVSVDLMKEAWRDMSKSFDAMVAAQSGATGGGGKGSGKGSGKAHAPNTIGALEQEIAEIKQERKELELNSDELRTQNALLERRKNLYKEQTTSPATKRIDSAMSMSTNKLDDAQKKLRLLEILQRRYAGTTELSVSQQNRLARAIQKTKEQIDKLKPKSLNDVLGMDANSIDQIAAKMRALKMVRIDPNNAAEVKRVGDAYAELKRKQAQLMGQNVQLTHSNNYLAQSFGYIRNRIVYALTLGALTNFVKQLYEIRGQYELLERSLGVLVGSFEKGTQIFNELNEMAIKSPFTLIELGTAAKQLTAYNFAANEVVDTTRRLADISAALGVPMERLTYNLGQIKAQGVLNARDARDFANAGLAIVPMLAKMYTEQKTFGDEMVTTAQVYDMMSKKMVTYSDVLKVLYRVTDEGGKFFDFQAKQADTLRVQMANLTLAYNNMLNEIGSENQGLLTAWVSGLKTLLKNWKEISRAILTLVTTLGTYKAVATIVSALNSRMFVGGVLVGLRNYILGIKNATGAMATFNAVTKANPIAFLISALVAAIGYFALFNHKVKETTIEMERFGENASKQIKKVETLGKVLAGIEEGSSTYKKALSDLNQIVSEYGLAEIKNRDEINSKIQQTIQLIKEEGKERQYANNIAKGEERYINDTGQAKSSLNESLLGLEGWFGTTSKVRKEILDNAEAITDVASSIIEENIGLVVNKTGQEAYDGLIEIQNRVRRGLKSSGLSNSAIDFILDKGYINSAIKDYRIATEEHERYNQKIKGYYDAATKATQSTMTFTEKVNANARALRNNTEDALSLYNRIYDIVKIAKENHVINFDLKLSAEKPPKWMFDKSLPELQKLAERFTAIAQSGGHAEGYNRESTYERGLMYASAARIKQEEEERKSRQKDKKTRTKQSDEIAKAIKEEISLVKELQSAYDTLTKKGDSHANAIAKVQDLYGKTIDLLNKDMDKFGLPKLDLSIIKGNNYNEVLAFFEKLRDVLESKGLSNLERMGAVEGVVKEFRLKAEAYNLDMITKGLNNELGKLKDEYELAVAIDADPELGSAFADMMGINIDNLPHTVEEYADRATKELNKYLGESKSGINLPHLFLTDDDLRAFEQMVKDNRLNEEVYNRIANAVKDVREKKKKDYDETIKEYNALIKKYGEYQAKIEEVRQTADKERVSFVKQYGTEADKSLAVRLNSSIAAEQDQSKKEELRAQLVSLVHTLAQGDDVKLKIAVAIDKSQSQQEAKTSFEEFQKSPEWIVATGDLAGMTNKAIGGLIDTIERYKKKAKNLDPKQIKSINNALKALYKQQRSNNPFNIIGNAIMEAKDRAATFEPRIKEIKDEMDKITADIAKGTATEKAKKRLGELIAEYEELTNAQRESGKVNATDVVGGINNAISAAQNAVSMFNQMAEALGGKGMTDASKTINRVANTLQMAGSGAAMGAQIGGGYGAIIGAVAGGLAGVITNWADVWSGNADITDNIEESVHWVKVLQREYKNLEYQIEKAAGTGKMYYQYLIASNKQLQLAELKRQLALEESRKAKNRDQNTIDSLKEQIDDLEREIKDTIDNIVNDFLGISGVGDAAESMMDAFIEALRNGEDAMAAFDESIDDMIANMIKKMFVTKILQPWFEKVWGQIQDEINSRAGEIPNELADVQNRLANARSEGRGSVGALRALGLSEEEIHRLNYFDANGEFDHGKDGFDRRAEVYDKIIAELEKQEKNLQEGLLEATTISTDDIRRYAELLRSGQPIMENQMQAVEDLLRELGLMNDDSSKNLSALQQGIQGITETTAGALEAYMNGVSQQVYLQSTLLTQIAETLQMFDVDVQTSTLGGILLQLQQSYQIQQSIQSILSGWSTPSGLAVRVEMN